MAERRSGRQATSSSADLAVRQAADILGWHGELLPQVSLLGTVTSIVIAFDHEAHTRRVELGTAHPVLDPDSLAIWEWRETGTAFPPAVVSIVGVLSHAGRSPVDLISSSRKWRGFAGCGVILPSGQPLPDNLQLECAYTGIAILQRQADGVELLREGADGRLPTARRTTVDRWVEEQLYGVALAQLELADTLL